MDPAPVERAFEAERVTREFVVDMLPSVAIFEKCLNVGIVGLEGVYKSSGLDRSLPEADVLKGIVVVLGLPEAAD